MKKLILLTLLLAVSLAVSLAAPALAQEGTVQDGSQAEEGIIQEGTVRDESPAKEGTEGEEPADRPPGPPPDEETATAAFELAVEGEPPEGTEFFYAIGVGQLFPLTDPDGDSIYTGSSEFVSEVLPIQTLPVQVLQSNADGTREVIRDFGLVTFDVDGEDKTFEASVSFEDGQEPRPGDEVTTTGVLEESGNDCNECAKHAITDETSGTTYYLLSDPQSPFGDYVDLDSYVDQRVTVSGILQMQGENNLWVTNIEPVGGSGEEVTITFELTVEGEVPEGQALYLDSIPGGDGPELIFCTAPRNPEAVSPDVPRCEDGATYSETQEVPADVPFSYEYFAAAPDGPQIFSAGTQTFTEDDTVSATYDANDPTWCDRDFIMGCGPEDVLTATFELTVTGKPPADATFFATGIFDPRLMDAAPLVRLTDPDGNGVYTASQDTIPGDYALRISQGTGTESCGPFGGECPGEPTRTIEDFGTVALEDDETFSASASFDNKGGVTTPDPGNGGSNGGGSGDGGSGSGLLGGVTDGVRGLLPSTGGGMALTVLGAGILLVAGGLLVRRLSR